MTIKEANQRIREIDPKASIHMLSHYKTRFKSYYVVSASSGTQEALSKLGGYSQHMTIDSAVEQFTTLGIES